MRPERISPNAVFSIAHYSEVVIQPGVEVGIDNVTPEEYARIYELHTKVASDGTRVVPIPDNKEVTVTIANGFTVEQFDIQDITYASQRDRNGNLGETHIDSVHPNLSDRTFQEALTSGMQWQGPGFVVRRPAKKP